MNVWSCYRTHGVRLALIVDVEGWCVNKEAFSALHSHKKIFTGLFQCCFVIADFSCHGVDLDPISGSKLCVGVEIPDFVVQRAGVRVS